MSKGLILETERALQQIAMNVRTYIPNFVSLLPDGSGSPGMVALRDALMAFPVPAEILYIKASPHCSIDEEPDLFTLLRFDMSSPQTLLVKFVQLLRSEELPASEPILAKHFGAFPGAISLICNLELGFMSDQDRFTFLVPYDIRKKPEECARTVANFLLDSNSFSRLFLRKIDFNSKYGLLPDIILSEDELLAKDPSSGQYRDRSYQQLTLRDRQEHMASIQLIPQVPESVKEVLQRAKRLYIFGHFEYSFFTIASHYTYSAMESAIVNRWNVTLPAKLRLDYLENTPQHQAVSVDRMGWRAIREYCRNQHWAPKNIRVNGTAFPINVAAIVDQLRRDGIINDYQRWRMRDVYLQLRNSHSHLEFCSTSLPGASTIERVAHEINLLFDSLPLE